MQTQNTGMNYKEVITHLVKLIEKGNAHVSLDEALKNVPFELLGKKPLNLPYSIWQLAEHIRIAQWDILEFSRSANHVSPEWPGDIGQLRKRRDLNRRGRNVLMQFRQTERRLLN